MVAKGVYPAHPAAVEAVKGWKEHWKGVTFGSAAESGVGRWGVDGDEEGGREIRGRGLTRKE
jgi:hypothetical protein